MASPGLPTCECIKALPEEAKLDAIYCALLAISQGGADGPTQQQLIDLGALIIGEIRDYAGDAEHLTPPPGWLYADGQAISRATYAALFGVIGIQFGPGNGTTTFNIPNLGGYVTAGFGNNGDPLDFGGANPGNFAAFQLGETGGEAAHVLTANTNQGGTGEQGNGSLLTGAALTDTDPVGNYDTAVGINSADVGHNTIQPTMLLNKIIFTGVI